MAYLSLMPKARSRVKHQGPMRRYHACRKARDQKTHSHQNMKSKASVTPNGHFRECSPFTPTKRGSTTRGDGGEAGLGGWDVRLSLSPHVLDTANRAKCPNLGLLGVDVCLVILRGGGGGGRTRPANYLSTRILLNSLMWLPRVVNFLGGGVGGAKNRHSKGTLCGRHLGLEEREHAEGRKGEEEESHDKRELPTCCP
ncbi:hypothetical protein LX32DRAFT_276355 [Colletotrichum zoysiae]|uniref:Uncharacterized protein n=1 Tax=Colletotrichum zoysiae TaxID=1216348 RepID=A0AAD9M753_9PEZI|nr:hypothetical protein LX32DRAFT_276355 [Colletotrichum zoysiae]